MTELSEKGSTSTVVVNLSDANGGSHWAWPSLSDGIKFDMMHRVTIDSSSNSLAVKSWKTSDFVLYYHQCELSHRKDIHALKLVTNWQRKYINYQSVYNAYLIGTLTDDEFAADVEQFVSEAKSVAPDILAPLIYRIHNLLDFQLSDNELAEYLEVDCDSVVNAVSLIENSGSEFVDEIVNHPAFRVME